MRVYEAIVRGLENLGVDAVFGGAGENAAGMMLALDASTRIRGIVTKNEQAAAFMACGYAMFTDKLGVCFATAGPGAFNLISGLCVALTDSYPLLAITGYSTVAWTGKGSLNETSGVGRTPNSQAMFSAVTKANFLLQDLADVSKVLQEAVDVAFSGRPGPVHIAVAEDITDPAMKVANFRAPELRVQPVAPDAKRVAEIAEFLAASLQKGKKIVLLAGAGAIRSRAYREIRQFVERYQIPLVTTLDGKGIVAEKHPLAIGVFSDSGHKSAWDVFLDADIVLAVGNSFAQHATFNFRDDLFENRTLIHINIDNGEIDKVYKADFALVSDAKLAIAAIARRWLRRSPPSRQKSSKRRTSTSNGSSSSTPSSIPASSYNRFRSSCPTEGWCSPTPGRTRPGSATTWSSRTGRISASRERTGPMGIGVNGALGVKCANPHRTVVAGVGDGCYLMSGFELMTAVHHDIPVIWVIFNDGEFKLIKLYQLASFHKSGLVEFPNPDYVTYAMACGADGYCVETIGEFESAFKAALASGRPTLIDARITRLALPHYSPSPEGVLAGIWEMVTKRFGSGD